MNLNQLKYFCTVCLFQTVSDAAEYLHISQPSLSGAIKDLENEFGVRLFRRHHRGMELTPEGEVLYKMGKDIILRAEQTENIMKDLGRERKKLRLGVPPMIGSVILPKIYRDFFSVHTDITPEIVEGGRSDLVQKLSDDYLDMIFVPHNRPLDSAFSTMEAARLEIVCCTQKDSPLFLQDVATPSLLKNIPLVLFEDSFFQTEEIKKWFVRGDVKPNILLQTAQLSTMLSIISNQIAAGFMFRKLIEKNTDFKAVPMQLPLYVNVSLVWKKESYSFAGMQKFKKYMGDNNPFISNS